MFEADPRKAFENKLVEIGEEYPKVVTISCDSAKGAGMSSFVERFPKRHIEVGISEQTAIGVCTGLAEVGFIPVISAITPFLTMRAYEFIRNDIGYAKMNVKIFGSGAGLAYSTLGASHSVIEDIAVMRTVPNMVILNPGDGNQVQEAVRLAVEFEGPVYIRMPRQKQREIIVDDPVYEIGKSKTLRKGSKVVFMATGTMINPTLEAAELLKEKGINATVESFLTICPLDERAVVEMANKYDLVVTVEEHSKLGGFGSMVSDLLMNESERPSFQLIGIDKNNVVGPYDEVLDVYGLSPEKIAQKVYEKYINR